MRGHLLGALALIASPCGAKPPRINLAPPPALKQTETFGDWTVTYTDKTLVIASVGNNAGAVFGSICYKGHCSAFFNPQIDCKDGDEYPALVNAPAAAFGVSLKCEKTGEIFLYTLPLEGGVAEAMSVGGVLGIAFPMQSGEFQVARFSLTGAARSSARASQIAGGSLESERQPASDNSTL